MYITSSPMGREGGNHPTVVGSSIALLQERFRQLEKMRERREEMELLKLFSGSDDQEINACTYEASSKLSVVQPEKKMIYDQQAPARQSPSTTLQDPPLSLGLNLFAESRATKKAPNWTDFWSSNRASVPVSSSRTSHDKPDVDTSLHL